MDLALAFGRPFEELADTLSERELKAWASYHKRRLLPMQRLELYLAQLTAWVARSSGVTGEIADFLIKFEPVAPTAEPAGTAAAPADPEIAQVAAALKFAPRFKKRV